MQLERSIENNSESYLAFGERKLVALVESLGLNEKREAYLRLFARLAGSLASLPLRSSPAWPSDLSDDSTPFEFSVAFSRARAQLRILVEPQTAPFTVRSNFEAGCALTSALGTLAGVDLEHLQRILPLFAPTASSSGRFAIWHAGAVEADGRESFKVYLNPGLDGREYSAPRLQAALRALNAGYAWKSLPAASGKPPELCYFSLDLSSAPDARIKLYVAHPGTTSAELDASLRSCGGFAPGFVREAIETLTGSAGPFCERPLLTCHAFRGPEQPPDVTVHAPVRCYVADDEEALKRASRLLDPASQATLEAATAAVAQRPLELGRGLVSYVSFRQEGESLRVTTYLAAEAFSVSTRRPKPVMVPRGPRADALERAEFGTVLALIEYERARLVRHPFLARLEGNGEPAQAAALARTLAFFVMCFQDVLRLSRQMAKDPELLTYLVTHENEDRGHDQWFLSDLEQLGVACDVRALFSPSHAGTRDVAYTLIGEVVSATHDATRLAVLLALEAAGAEFFGRVIGFLERMNLDAGMRYFARSHQHVEQAHEVFEDGAQDRLRQQPIDPSALPEVRRAVEQTFEAMTRLGDHSERAIQSLGNQRMSA